MMMELTKRHNKHYYLLTWKLWNHLLHPRENVVFNRAIRQKYGQRLTFYHLCLILMGGAALSFGIVSFLKPLKLEFPVEALIILAIFSAIITVIWLVSIATTVTHEYQQATHDLICVTPSGKIGAYWSIATGILHRQDLLRLIDSAHRWFSGLILLILGSIVIPVILSSSGDNRTSSLEVIILVLELLVFVIFSYDEFIQSVLQGVLIAMLIPRFIHSTSDVVAVWAIFIFITLQVVIITILLVSGIFIQSVFTMNSLQYPSILPQLLLFFAMREACIYGLWKFLKHQLNAETDDLNQI